MPTILDRIVQAKRVELARNRAAVSESELEAKALATAPRGGFAASLTPAERGAEIRLIAEIKKASPSRGLIREDFDPTRIAGQYEAGGAAAISVLTDKEFFQGSLDYLREVSEATPLPLLRKDFALERYQILEAREAGASAILLIIAILDDATLSQLLDDAGALGLDVLMEAHSAEELDRALATDAPTIGINNRDLATFNVDLATTLELRPRIPDERTVVSESGIFTRADVLRLQDAGVDAILVGESLMRQPDPGEAARGLIAG